MQQPDGGSVPRGRSLTLNIVETLGRAIVIGRYDNRPFPIEAEITRTHGVSHSVTREAVKMLTAKGLLSARPRIGTVVEPSGSWNLFDPDVLRWSLERKLSYDLLREFNQLRMGIEPEAAAIAAQLRDMPALEEVRAGLAAMRSAEDGNADPLEADIRFHVAILRATNNPFYIQLRNVVATALRASIQHTNRLKGHTANIDDHAAVLNAIAGRDPSGARDAMRKIVADVLDLIPKA
jgi:DNA-binding FadR family transcriptional regulator